MSFRLGLVVSGGLVAFSAGCGDTDETVPPGGFGAALSFVTFNAAQLAGLAPYPERRLAATARDLPGLDADVVCLQELWQPELIERLVDDLSADFPYSHWSFLRGSGGGSCTTEEASGLSECLLANCSGVEGSALALCAVQSCADLFTAVSAECQGCIAANQSTMDLQQLTSLCSSAEGGSAEGSSAEGSSAEGGAAPSVAAYTDQSGLLLLSRLPLVALGYRAYESSLGDRGALSARVQTAPAGSVDVYCTHLAATLSDIPYTGRFGSWEGERLAQLEAYLEYAAETRLPGGAAALLGDMNCGPETEQAGGAGPADFARFEAAGFSAPYVEQDGRCTWCSDNPLTNGGGSDAGSILDHVLVSGFAAGEPSVARIFDELIDVSVEGDGVQTTRSDHYGVQVTFSGAESAP